MNVREVREKSCNWSRDDIDGASSRVSVWVHNAVLHLCQGIEHSHIFFSCASVDFYSTNITGGFEFELVISKFNSESELGFDFDSLVRLLSQSDILTSWLTGSVASSNIGNDCTLGAEAFLGDQG